MSQLIYIKIQYLKGQYISPYTIHISMLIPHIYLQLYLYIHQSIINLNND